MGKGITVSGLGVNKQTIDYTGDGITPRNLPHTIGKIPDIIFISFGTSNFMEVYMRIDNSFFGIGDTYFVLHDAGSGQSPRFTGTDEYNVVLNSANILGNTYRLILIG